MNSEELIQKTIAIHEAVQKSINTLYKAVQSLENRDSQQDDVNKSVMESFKSYGEIIGKLMEKIESLERRVEDLSLEKPNEVVH